VDCGVDANTTISTSAYSDKVIYTLVNEDALGFYKYTGATLGANKVFLALDAAVSAGIPGFVFQFEENVTGVNSVQREQSYYTLDGCQLNGKPTQKGLYIYNGKKVVIK